MAGARSVLGFHVNRALEFYRLNSIFFALAKQTPWEDPDNIPDPLSDSQLDNPWGFKRVESRYLVVPDNESGTIVYKGSKWRVVSEETAYAEKCRWVYISSFIYYDELPMKTYHQVGVLTGLQLNDGVPPGKVNVLPEDVKSLGTLEILDFRPGISRSPDMREQIGQIIEF